MATRAELEVAAGLLYDYIGGLLSRDRALDIARDMLEAAEEVRLNEMQNIFGGNACKACGAIHFKRE